MESLKFSPDDVDFELPRSSLIESTIVLARRTMISATKSAFKASVAANGTWFARSASVALRLRADTKAIIPKLMGLAPYALIELVLPGGSVMALLLWLYRRRKKPSVSAPHEIHSGRPDEPMMLRTT
ncbi:MAG TPA: hypothetical protein VGN30_00035 [Steroidobacteraceae bacterium]|jgi:hypothetical protein